MSHAIGLPEIAALMVLLGIHLVIIPVLMMSFVCT